MSDDLKFYICEHAGTDGACMSVSLKALRSRVQKKREAAERYADHADLAVSAGANATIGVCDLVLAELEKLR